MSARRVGRSALASNVGGHCYAGNCNLIAPQFFRLYWSGTLDRPNCSSKLLNKQYDGLTRGNAEYSHVNRRGRQAAAGIGSNAVKAIKKGRSGWGHDRRRLRPHPDVDSIIRHKELLQLVRGALFGADLHTVRSPDLLRCPHFGRHRRPHRCADEPELMLHSFDEGL
jgi:hypothetical protein